MRTKAWVGAVLGILGLSGPGLGQTGDSSGAFSMPGVPVGTGVNLHPVAPLKPKVGNQVGNQVGSGIGSIFKPNSQDFSNIDPSQLAAPLPNFSGIGGSPSLWDRTKQKFVSLGNFFSPTTNAMEASRPRWAPGISRRNRSRLHERLKPQD